MKVKIRGLVFVGFAAAVFAQSAMADATTDAKTVTSKLYVDNKVDKVTGEGTQASPYGNTTITENSPNDKAPSSQNVYKFVTTTVGNVAGNINGDNEYTKVTSTTSNDVTTKTVELQQTPATANSGITGTLDTTTEKKLVTAGAVKSLIDTTAISSSSDATHLPTSQAVYNYAQPKVSTANALQVGYYTGSGNAAWKTLQADDTASVTHYVSIAQKTGDTNTYNVNLDNSTIASATTDFVASSDTNATTKRPKLATAGAVYDFVTAQGGNFQPKDTQQATANSVRIGYNSDGSTPGWGTLSGLSDGYVSVSGTNGDYTMTIPSGKLTGSSSSTDLTGSVNATTGVLTALTTSEQVKLVKAGAIEDLIDAETAQNTTTITGAVAGNGKVPTSKNVYDFVTGYAQDTYQPKVGVAASYDSTFNNGTGRSKVMVGYTTRTGTSPDYTYTSEWQELKGLGYVLVQDDPENGPAVWIDDNQVASAGSGISSATSSSGVGDDLTTAWAVKEYVTGLTGGLTIPTMPQECTTAAEAGGYCALVYGLVSGSGANATYGLQWTVMAPVPTTGGE